MAHSTKGQIRGGWWESRVAAGLKRWGFKTAHYCPKKGVGDVLGLPFLVECKAYAETSWRPSEAAKWVRKADTQAAACRLPFGIVIAHLHGGQRLEHALWLMSPESYALARAVLPELVPISTYPTGTIALPVTVPDTVIALVHKGFPGLSRA
ncbi:hypothetical protein ABH935_003196 [Catenulispora sp. GAS73]